MRSRKKPPLSPLDAQSPNPQRAKRETSLLHSPTRTRREGARGEGGRAGRNESRFQTFENAHEMAEAFLAKFDIDPKVRRQLDRQTNQEVGHRMTAKRKMNVEAMHPILAKQPWDRSPDEVALVHAEISKAHCFDKIHVSPDAEFEICKVATLETFPQIGRAVFREGDVGDKFYVILEGSVHIETKAKGMLVALFEGDSFGEIAILHETMRTASVWVEDPAKLISVSKRDYDRRIRPFHAIEEEMEWKEYRSIPAFDCMDDGSIQALIQKTSLKRFTITSKIIEEGKECNFGMFIIKGFVETWKKIGDKEIKYDTLGPGQTLDLSSVVTGRPVSFTAVAGACVDVMCLARKDIVPPKDSGVKSLIDDESMEKLLDREKGPPDGAELQEYVDNEELWKDFKDQVVSSVLWDKRWEKHSPKVPINFNKYCRMPMKLRSSDDHHEALTANLANGALPAHLQDVNSASRRNVLQNVMIGDKMHEPSNLDKIIKDALDKESPHPGAVQTTKPEETTPSSRRPASALSLSMPFTTIAGTLWPTPMYLRNRWEAQQSGYSSGERHDLLRPKSALKNIGAPKLAQRQLYIKASEWKGQGKVPAARENSHTDSDLSDEKGVWIPNGSAKLGNPFSAPCHPAPSWGQTPDRWMLRPRERPMSSSSDSVRPSLRGKKTFRPSSGRPDELARSWVFDTQPGNLLHAERREDGLSPEPWHPAGTSSGREMPFNEANSKYPFCAKF